MDIRGYLAPVIPEDRLIDQPPGIIARPLDGGQTLPGLPTGIQEMEGNYYRGGY